MAIGTVSVFNVEIASGVSTSTAIDLGRGYAKVIFDITGVTEPCMFLTAPTLTGTYRMVKHAVSSGMSAPQTATVGTACSGGLTEVGPLAGIRYIKVAAAATIADGTTAKIYCSDI